MLFRSFLGLTQLSIDLIKPNFKKNEKRKENLRSTYYGGANN